MSFILLECSISKIILSNKHIHTKILLINYFNYLINYSNKLITLITTRYCRSHVSPHRAEQRRTFPLASSTRYQQPIFDKLGYILSGRSVSLDVLSLVQLQKINISIIIANIANRYGTLCSSRPYLSSCE